MSDHSHDIHGHAHDHDHGHGGGHDHGSYASYLRGFILSVVLTAIPFALVMSGAIESRAVTITIVLLCAFVQVLVHMVYFLHMNTRSDEGWNFIATIFTIVVVVIMLAGSLWVMYNMNTNMMPQMNHEALSGFGS
ncbi:cytochrome o ubiquinol oxidase subunit IV [Paracoccus aminophilus]|uniref:Cytochrome bo(3) ubiquinol oxidase subunit 4 n=1 Tax=Paracoccus aminophilus JCM 7686 TaxID=1367847 RepID=S5XYG3_PARAH|nr:cytochrome c oxidase, subunit IV [Paracoccus aminophilus JCM 7686]